MSINGPILDMRAVIAQVQTNTTLFKEIRGTSSIAKSTKQITPESLPYVGLSPSMGTAQENFTNESMRQNINIIVSAVIVMETNDDFTGLGPTVLLFDDLFQDLNRALYNWQPSQQRYLNGFQIDTFERIDSLSDNPYEVWCVNYSIPAQMDYLDGYLTEGQKLQLDVTQQTGNLTIKYPVR